MVYDRARQAIEAGDFDMGFELVESDWKLKFPQADPQLAAVEATGARSGAGAATDTGGGGAAGVREFVDDVVGSV